MGIFGKIFGSKKLAPNDPTAQAFQGLLCHNQEDYAGAMKWYKLAAAQNYAIAQLTLGKMYRDGEGVSQDPTEAMKWFKLAAAQGDKTNGQAQYIIGDMYRDGEGVSQDYAEAMKWFKLAAAQSDQTAGLAQFNIGNMYQNGKGVSQDSTEAIKWFKLSAAQGFVMAQFNIDKINKTGVWLPK